MCDDKAASAQVRDEAMAGAQEKLEATRRALDKRREELRGLERQARPALLSSGCAVLWSACDLRPHAV